MRANKTTNKIDEDKYTHVQHTFEPVFDQNSKVLVLGSFPSVKSREQKFYYGHPQNRFWKVIAAITKSDVPETVEEKQAMLLANHIAVWDVIESCDIIGSSDSSIRNVRVNDFTRVLENSSIEAIYANGAKAYDLYQKYAKSVLEEHTTKIDCPIYKLPSTSPANAAWSVERLCTEWKQLI